MSVKRIPEDDIAWGATGLVPAIVQNAADSRVLMLAYMDAEALASTLATFEVHFHSRSRDRLWRKGETSGNVLRLLDIEIDCDGDALLLQVEPVGPTCHRGTRSCFDDAEGPALLRPDGSAALPGSPDGLPGSAPGRSLAAGSGGKQPPSSQGFEWLETLWATIDERSAADPSASYTARLLAKGVDGPARKVAEEATEVLMAAKDDAVAADAAPDTRPATLDALTGEVADLLYHTLVLLRERGLAPSAVMARLRERHRA